ncbi:MAG: AAA family ATPase [Blastocatellia bacterium]|nr:AAA family ATPase [Blastocatellia bacterium]
MYTEHFGFREDPFGVSPDPRFLYLGPGHQEAFAALMYGVKMRRGFICLTGEPGTGKTTLLYALLEQLENSVRTVFLPGTDLTFKQRLQFILESLGSKPQGGTVLSLTRQLQDLLADQWRSGNNVVLIFDEAQNLSIREMEDIRLLTNFEVPQAKLLQVMLVGQPQLKSKLGLSELAQLKQRITVNVNLRPLTMSETSEYIEHRLRCTEWNKPLHSLMSRPVLAAIYEASHGIPRLINAVCHNALLVAYAENKYRIELPMVKEAAQELDLFESVPLIDPVAASKATDPEMQQWLVAMSAEADDQMSSEADAQTVAAQVTRQQAELVSEAAHSGAASAQSSPMIAPPPVVTPSVAPSVALADVSHESWSQPTQPEPADGVAPLATVPAQAATLTPEVAVETAPVSTQAAVVSLSDSTASAPVVSVEPDQTSELRKDFASEAAPAVTGSDGKTSDESDNQAPSAATAPASKVGDVAESSESGSNVTPFKPKAAGRFRPAYGRVPGVPAPLVGAEAERRPAFVGLSAPARAVEPALDMPPAPAPDTVPAVTHDKTNSSPVERPLNVRLANEYPSSLSRPRWQQSQPVGLSMDQLLDELETFIQARAGRPTTAHQDEQLLAGVRSAALGKLMDESDAMRSFWSEPTEAEFDRNVQPSTDSEPIPRVKHDFAIGATPQTWDHSWTRPEPVRVPLSRIEVPQHWSRPQLFAAALFLALFALCVGLVGGFVITKFYGGQITAWMTHGVSRWPVKMTAGQLATMPGKTEISTSPLMIPTGPLAPASVSSALPGGEANPAEATPHMVIVGPGETLLSIMRREYGAVTPRLVNRVRAANPHVYNWDELPSGTALLLPPLPEADDVEHRSSQ